MAKAAPWDNTDAQTRKRGEQTGLDTLVVHALNDVDLEVVPMRRGFGANALNRPPGSGRRLNSNELIGGHKVEHVD